MSGFLWQGVWYTLTIWVGTHMGGFLWQGVRDTLTICVVARSEGYSFNMSCDTDECFLMARSKGYSYNMSCYTYEWFLMARSEEYSYKWCDLCIDCGWRPVWPRESCIWQLRIPWGNLHQSLMDLTLQSFRIHYLAQTNLINISLWTTVD